MVLRAKEHGLVPTALAVAALLSGRDPASDRSDADLASRVARLAVGDEAAREARRVRAQLARALREPVGTPDPDATGEAVALAYPDRLARARPGDPGAFRLASGKGARLDPTDALAREPWLAVAAVDDGAEGRIRLAASLSPASLEALHGSRFTTEDRVVFDPRQQAIVASRVLRLGALTIKEQPLSTPDPERVLAAWCQAIRARGAGVLPWSEPARRLQARVEFLRRRDPQAWPAFDDPALLADLDSWLGDELMALRRLDELKRLDLAAALRRRLDGRQRHELDRRAPATLTVPTGRQVAIDYGVDPPVLAVKLQELFGLATTPAVDEGRVALSLQLLSPAQRPIAVTRDLAGFWAGGYAAVRKELRGRYPKHPWPEDPLASPPTRGVRARP
jgi:ATP-dependent helicase HrpB